MPDLPFDLDGAKFPVDILPFQTDNFGLSHAGMDCQIIQRVEPVTDFSGRFQQGFDLLSIIEFHLCLLGPGWYCSGAGIAADHTKLDSMVHCHPEGFVDNVYSMVA